jgi:hypothetical protein
VAALPGALRTRQPVVAALLALTAALVAVHSPPAARAAVRQPFSFLATPTDQLGVPGLFATSEVTPEGDLYTGYGELAFELGSPLRAYDQPLRSLEDNRYPIIRSSVERSGVTYTVTMLATPVDGVSVNLVRVAMRNTGRRPQTAVWAVGMRRSGGAGLTSQKAPDFRYLAPSGIQNGLYAQPGGAPSAASRWHLGGRAIVRDGRAYAFLPASRRGRRVALTRTCALRTEICIAVSYVRRLAPGRGTVLDFAMPAVPVTPQGRTAGLIAGLAYSRADAALRAAWAASLRPATRLRVPEQAVDDAYHASLTHILTSRFRLPKSNDGISRLWVQTVNDLQYHAFWLRDAAIISNALDLAGLHSIAAEDLAYFPVWQHPSGLFISRTGQYDGIGQALWAIGRHAQLTADKAFARDEVASVAAAVRWIAAKVALDPLGLMPVSSPGDNEFTTGHLAGDDFWAIAGLDAAIRLVGLAGQPQLAASWIDLLDGFRASVAKATRAAAARAGGIVPPSLDHSGGRDWGNWWVGYPDGPLALDDPIVTATIDRADAGLREGIATYDNGRLLHDYLGFRILETQLERGDQAPVVAGLYSEIAHSSGTYGGFETNIGPLGKRSNATNLSPHATYSAELVTLLRNMLVRDDGSVIHLLGALPTAWLEPGKVTTVTRAPTTLGAVSVRLSTHPGGATLTWSTPGPAAAVWPVPYGVSDFRASLGTLSGRTLILPSPSGTLEVTWKLGRPTTLAETIDALRNDYKSHGTPFPAG